MTAALVRFDVGPHACAIEIGEVQEVIRMVAVTPLPRVPRFIEGMINLRGVVIPVLDLRRRFGLAVPPADTATRIVITHLGRTAAGLIVDDVSDIVTAAQIDSGVDPTDSLGVDLRRFVSRVVRTEETLLLVLDPRTLLTDIELDALNAAVEDGNGTAS